GLQLLDGAIEQHRYVDVLSLQLLHRQQAVEGELPGAGQTPQDLQIVLIEPEDEDVPGHHCSLAATAPWRRCGPPVVGPACPTTGPPAPRARQRVRRPRVPDNGSAGPACPTSGPSVLRPSRPMAGARC